MKKTKSNVIKSLVSVALMLVILISGAGSVKSYAYTKNSSYAAEISCAGLFDRIIKSLNRAEDMIYNSYLENIYGMVLNKRYEFVGSTVLTVASNTGFLRRNYYEETVYSNDEVYFAVRDKKMEKAVQYWGNNGATVINLYYKNKNDRKPSYVCYRFEKKNDPNTCAFFTYDMTGKLVDVSAWDEYYKGIKCDIYKADYSSCGYLYNLAYDFVGHDLCDAAGPSVVKITKNTYFLKRNFTEEVHYASDEESEDAGFFVLDKRMEKTVQYWDENGAVFSVYYEKLNDKNPSYVCYRYQNKENDESVIFATYDMQGVLLEAWYPFGY